MKVAIKKMDAHGRIVLPVSWRRRADDELVVVERDEKLEIFPRDVDLAKYLDSVEVESDTFDDYHELRKELRKK